ncbi:MAG TPA: anaerobic ribonucleoside-triphosphate reductase activating protein [Clostridiales bacterium]|jgi:anaerobic ribonucleoside-triphosphate reductase activating protein|nr:anaerobic ribonucleoside-triphosphate reductase activating protein [Clostridiales bacterium]
MRIADYIQDSIVDGPGLRFTLFTQGCPHRCEGCHNPQTHDFQGGREMSAGEIIKIMLSNPLTDGITLTGGEPFCQPEDCAAIARAAKEHGLNVWAYSGWTFEELMNDDRPAVRELLKLCDVLVDGPFILEQRSLTLKWRGSHNQRVLDVPKSLATGEAVLYNK